MAEKWSTKGAFAPLFDRLSDFEPNVKEENPPFMIYDEDAIKTSIQHECMRILNTRCMLTKEEYAKLQSDATKFRFPRFFGLPDSIYANPKNTSDATFMQETMAKAIEIFETRLQNVHVAIHGYEEDNQELFLSVEGDLVIGEIRKSIAFPLSLGHLQEQGEREQIAYDKRPTIELNGKNYKA
jgi:type VI secretion system lysozyme-like protein